MLLTVTDAPHSFRYLPAVRYGTAPDLPGADAALYLSMCLPDPRPAAPMPAVVYIHGGGWDSGGRDEGLHPWICPLLAAHGFAAITIDHRSSDVAAFPAQIHDAKAAIRWVRAQGPEYGIDPGRIGAWGDSSGGHLAALLGLTAQVEELEGNSGNPGLPTDLQAVVVRCGSIDFNGFGEDVPDAAPPAKLFGGRFGERHALRTLASPVTHAHGGAPPFRLVHGTDDERIPFAHAQALHQALLDRGAEVTLQAISGGHHNLLADPDLPWTDEPWERIGYEDLAFFTQSLGR